MRQLVFKQREESMNIQCKAKMLTHLLLKAIGSILHKFLIQQPDNIPHFVGRIIGDESIDSHSYRSINNCTLYHVLYLIDIRIFVLSETPEVATDCLTQLQATSNQFAHSKYSYDYKSRSNRRSSGGQKWGRGEGEGRKGGG